MSFAEWLSDQMADYSLTIYQISKRSGVHQTTIKNWLDGAKPQGPKEESVRKAVIDLVQERRALINELPWESLAVEKERPADGEALTDEQKELLTLSKKMSDDELKRFIAAMKAMLGESM